MIYEVLRMVSEVLQYLWASHVHVYAVCCMRVYVYSDDSLAAYAYA